MDVNRNVAHKLANLGILTTLAVFFGYIEYLIPFNFGIPGVKLGLANVVTLYALYIFEKKDAFFILVLRIIIVGFLFGNLFAIFYSLAGGIFSLLVMCFAKKINRLSMVGVSILGGIFHNLGQLILACFLITEIRIFYYLPVLVIAGAVTGLLIGICAKIIFDRVNPEALT